MKRLKIFRVFFAFIVVSSFIGALEVSFCEEELLSQDPRLTQATAALKNGEELMAKGEREMRQDPVRALEYFKKAEGEFKKSGVLYKELGDKHNIRIVNEVQKCEKLARRAHVRAGKARKEQNRKMRGFM